MCCSGTLVHECLISETAQAAARTLFETRVPASDESGSSCNTALAGMWLQQLAVPAAVPAGMSAALDKHQSDGQQPLMVG